ncbi:MAG: ABC transporter ATP-binding protein [bacterium]
MVAQSSILTTPAPGGVLLEKVCKAFEEAGKRRLVLDHLDLQAATGEFISIRGPSGSGKSTLLNVLGGIDLADSGAVQVGDLELNGLGETARTLFRRHQVGFVFQFFNLVPTLTVAENLRLPLELCKKYQGDSEIEHWLERFNLVDRAKSYPDVLSGGEQQRIAVIRAAIHKPVLILADEPTGNLDAVAGESVLMLLREVVEQGACVIMATHSRDAAKVADRHLTLMDGQLHPDSIS